MYAECGVSGMNLSIVFVVISYQFQELHCFECPGNHDKYIRRENRYCLKIYNCKQDNEIRDCTVNCAPDSCTPCAHAQKQPFLIHSTTPADDRKCFKPEGSCDDEDLVPVRNGTASIGCPKSAFCQCSLHNCFYGTDPCNCKKIAPCPVNEYLGYDGSKYTCMKCPHGTRKERPGCGPCRMVVPATRSAINTSVVKLPSERQNLLFPSTNSTTTAVTGRPSSTENDKDMLPIIIVAVVGVAGLFVVVVLFVVCLRRRRLNCYYLNKAVTTEENVNEEENEIDRRTVSSPLILPDDSLSSVPLTPKSPVVSETGQPGAYHPSDPRALRQTRGAVQGQSLEDESHTDCSVSTSDTRLLNTSYTELLAVDSIGKSEGVNYLLNKLSDDETNVKQPVQCEEDTLQSNTFQKYPHSDVTNQKEILCEGGYHSLTDEKLLCSTRCVSDTTEQKYYMNV